MKIDASKMFISQNSPFRNSSEKSPEISDKEKKREIKLQQTSKDLEAIFITQMFKVMEKTIPKSALGGSKNTLASMMFSSVMGKALANQGGIGLSEVIYNSLKEKDEIPSLEEIQSNPFMHNVKAFGLTNTDIGE